MESNSNKIVDGALVITENTIDVKELIRAKNPRMLRMLPGFIIRYLKRILHEKEVNYHMYNNRHKHGLPFVEAMLDMFGAEIVVYGLEKLENQNRFLVVANHPLGGLDGLALMHTVGRIHSNIVFPVNDFLMYLPNLSELFVPINKVGGQSSSGVRALEKAFESDNNILFFPAGLASRKIKGKVIDLEWKKTFIQKARQHERNVIPVHVSGRNSNRFYRLANWRKRLGIKANIEMLYLSDETFRQKGRILEIHFGDPIPFSTFDKTHKDLEWAQIVKQIVYDLPQND
ncbi:MAG: glycerol acyltransferase [Bacteroidetes bacterium HGW-Bacteroidetes-6]|jgi:putative hemolysin|nr:MAG: glycerol acyltransferase [Bacteroidetes bacterium HGW-Bacteroidetes-6]